MKRLTKRHEDGRVGFAGEYGNPPYPVVTEQALDRLAAYEDTGLEPEEILTGKVMAELYGALKKLKRYEQAEQDGRLLVLPCKVGDTVYAVGAQQIKQCHVDEIILDKGNEVTCMVSFNCDNDCEGCYFDAWHREYSGELSCDGEFGESTVKGEAFDKTVFLTREEAEAALEGED